LKKNHHKSSLKNMKQAIGLFISNSLGIRLNLFFIFDNPGNEFRKNHTKSSLFLNAKSFFTCKITYYKQGI
jgi:hypothetical protein